MHLAFPYAQTPGAARAWRRPLCKSLALCASGVSSDLALSLSLADLAHSRERGAALGASPLAPSVECLTYWWRLRHLAAFRVCWWGGAGWRGLDQAAAPLFGGNS